MTFCASGDRFLLGKRGANADGVVTHSTEIGHFTVSTGGFGVFGTVVWGKNGEHDS